MPDPAYRSGSTYQSGSDFSGTTVVLSKPSGVVSGDVLIALIAFVNQLATNTRTISPPDGTWTQLQHSNDMLYGGDTTAATLFFKVAGGSEPSTYTFTISDGDGSYREGVMLAISDAAGVSVSGKMYFNSSGIIVRTPNVVGSGVCLDIRWALTRYLSHTLGAPSGYTARETVMQSSINSRIATATKLQASAGAYGDKDFSISGTVSGPQLGFSALARAAQETTDSETVGLKLTPEYMEEHLGVNSPTTDSDTGAVLFTPSGVDGMEYTDSGTPRLSLTPITTFEGITWTDAATVLFAFTPITTHECKGKLIISVEVVSANNRWEAIGSFNKFNNAVSQTRWQVAYVGVDPSEEAC